MCDCWLAGRPFVAVPTVRVAQRACSGGVDQATEGVAGCPPNLASDSVGQQSAEIARAPPTYHHRRGLPVRIGNRGSRVCWPGAVVPSVAVRSTYAATSASAILRTSPVLRAEASVRRMCTVNPRPVRRCVLVTFTPPRKYGAGRSMSDQRSAPHAQNPINVVATDFSVGASPVAAKSRDEQWMRFGSRWV